MKIRRGYVSNSSSSSFLISEDLTEKGIACLKLTNAQKELLNGAWIQGGKEQIGINFDKDIYLTEYIYDGNDKKWEIVTSIEHMEYEDGQMCGEPYEYEIEYFNEYQINGKSVYLRKEHDEAKQMTFEEFIKDYKKNNLANEIIVKYTSDGVYLKYIKW